MKEVLAQVINSLEDNFNEISDSRKLLLSKVADDIQILLDKKETAKLVFICTHNSRRSQFGQVWASAAAQHYSIERIETFSGGTETTCFNKSALNAIESDGFSVNEIEKSNNPRYLIKGLKNWNPSICFSKKYDDETNPETNFLALMTCDQADEACPLISCASSRFALNYLDPKVADGTPNEKQVYQMRSRQIATEMLFLFSTVKKAK